MATNKPAKKTEKKSSVKAVKKSTPSAKKISSGRKSNSAKREKIVVTKKADGSSSVRKGNGFVSNLPSEKAKNAPTTAPKLISKKVAPKVADFSKSPLAQVLLKVRLTDASLSKDVNTLHKLASDQNARVRLGIAENEHTDEKDIIILVSDADSDVRRAAAANPVIHFRILDDLAHTALLDKDIPVLEGIASNWRTDSLTLERLSLHRSEDIRAHVAANYNGSDLTLLNKLMKSKSVHIKLAVAGNKYTEVEDLHTLAYSSNPSIQFAVAGNEGADRETLEFLIKSSNHKNVIDLARFTLGHYSE